VQPSRKPSGALLKAFLINGAAALPGQFSQEVPAGANKVSGFGRIDVTQSLIPEPLRRTVFADDPGHGMSTGQMRTYQVQAADLTRALKVTLVWADAPAGADDGGLENRPYLRVQAPDGGVSDGDTSPSPTATNNVQQVLIAAPVAGVYTIRVHGVSVTQQAPRGEPGRRPLSGLRPGRLQRRSHRPPPDGDEEAVAPTASMVFSG
jgi:serine protease AprX